VDQAIVAIAVALAVIIVIPAYRVIVGPTLFDRLLGTGAIGTKTVALICIVGVVFERLDMFVDIAVGYAILNFIGNLAIAKYFIVPKPDEHPPAESI
jgi:multicomponent Na+:H+ antiporter subunit F